MRYLLIKNMENKLINELYRINKLMGVDNIIVENVGPPINALRKLFSSLTDNAIDKIVVKTGVSATDNEIANTIAKLKAGEKITQKSLNTLMSQLDGVKLAKLFSKNKKLMGEGFYTEIENLKKLLESNPNKYNDVIAQINNTIDNVPYLRDLPDNLKNSLKLELKASMDAAKDIGVQAKKAAKAPNIAPIVDNSLTNRLITSVTPAQLDAQLKNSITQLGIKKFKLTGKNLELFRDELIGFFNREFNEKFITDYSSKLSFVSDKLNNLPPSEKNALLTNVTTNLEKSFGDILDKSKLSVINKKELKDLLKFGFSKPFEGTMFARLIWILKWWVHTVKISGAIGVVTFLSDFTQWDFDRYTKEGYSSFLALLRRLFIPIWNIIESIYNVVDSLVSGAIKVSDDKQKEQGILDKAENEVFKRKVQKKYPSFKFTDDIIHRNGQPYLIINDSSYPIYEDGNNGKYFIKDENGDGIYFDNLTN